MILVLINLLMSGPASFTFILKDHFSVNSVEFCQYTFQRDQASFGEPNVDSKAHHFHSMKLRAVSYNTVSIGFFFFG